MSPPAALQPLPGRQCGDCAVCCVELEIDEPKLRKAAETPCPHLCSEGCGIYAERPDTCASWHCGWRLLNVGEGLRPDRAGVLMIPEISREPGYERGGLTLTPVAGRADRLLQAEIVDLAGRYIAGGVPIFLAHGAGVHCKRVFLNRRAEPMVRAGDRARFVALLTDLLQQIEAQIARERTNVPAASDA